MTKKIITTYTEYDEDGKIKSQSVTETPYPEDDCDLDCECCVLGTVSGRHGRTWLHTGG